MTLPPLTKADLRHRVWQFRYRDGPMVAARLRLIGDGAIAGATGPFQALWTLDDGVLVFHTLDGTPTTRFNRGTAEPGGRIALEGDFSIAPDLGLSFGLESALPPDYTPPPPQRLQVQMSLGSTDRPLLILFNSHGRAFTGLDTRWEFFNLPRAFGLDHIRIAERNDPAFWYVDQMPAICTLLETVLARGYPRLLLAGLSSGGYASMLAGELMTARLPDLRIDSFTINPQTGQDRNHRATVGKFDPGLIPVMMSDESFEAVCSMDHDIPALIRGNRQRDNIVHHIFYDHDNPAERYYVDQVRGLDGIRPVPFHFGVGHLWGCIGLMERGVVQDAIADTLREGA